MAKFAVEVDSDTHEAKFVIDGQEYPVEEFSVSRYVCRPCGDTSTGYTDTYISMTVKNGDESFTRSIQFRDSNPSDYQESTMVGSPAKEIAKVISRLIATSKLSQALTKIKTGK
jgi:hypothetical protein